MTQDDRKPGTGAIFKNERKENEKHPDYRGVIISPKGEEMQVALWLKAAQTTGKKYFSVAASTPYRESEVVGAAAALAGAVETTPTSSTIESDDLGLPF